MWCKTDQNTFLLQYPGRKSKNLNLYVYLHNFSTSCHTTTNKEYQTLSDVTLVSLILYGYQKLTSKDLLKFYSKICKFNSESYSTFTKRGIATR